MTEDPLRKFYLTTGFHRSGTSLLAQTLEKNGIDMGDELMGATFSNRLGHVEDMPVVRLHDKIYQFNGCDWRFHDSCQLTKPVWLQNYIKAYLQKRCTSDSKLIGVKDPRAVHFLKDWQIAGQGNLYFIFIYRHWRYAAHSLLNRHSRHMLNSALPVSFHKLNYSFWQQPELAYEMWRTANQRVLNFYKEHKDKCVLISQEALVSGNRLNREAAERLMLTQDTFGAHTFNERLISSSVPDSSEAMLTESYIQQLDELQDELDANADLQTAESRPAKTITKQTLTNPKDASSAPDQPRVDIFADAEYDLSELTWSELPGALVRIPTNRVKVAHFLEVLRKNAPSVDGLMATAKVAHRHGLWLVTRVIKIRANLLDCVNNNRLPNNFSHWKIGIEDEHWLMQNDAQLARPNPFSLRPVEELPDVLAHKANSAKDVLDDIDSVGGSDAEALLSALLLTRALTIAQLVSIADKARDLALTHIEEFTLFKLLYQYTRVIAKEDVDRVSERLSSILNGQGHSALASAFRVSCDKAPLQQSISGQKTSDRTKLKHRFAVVPHNLPYSDIIEVTRENPSVGEKLDRLNQRVNFLVKSNVEWISNATSALTDSAASSLKETIYRHWSKVWPQSVIDYVLEGKVSINAEMPELLAKLNTSTISPSSCELFMRNPSPQSVCVFAALVGELKVDLSLRLLFTESEVQRLPETFKAFVDGVSFISIYTTAEPFQLHKHGNLWLSSAGQWRGLVDGAVLEDDTQRGKQVLQWYSMLGFESGLSMLSPVSEPVGIISSYLPYDLDNLQDKPLYYPDSATFWLSQHACNIIANVKDIGPHRYLLSCLAVLNKNQANLMFSHDANKVTTAPHMQYDRER